jgi:hypothetical protein
VTRICHSCGTVPAAGDRYCTICGSHLNHAGLPGSDLPTDSPPAPSPRTGSSSRRRRAVTALVVIALVSGGAGVYVGLPSHRPAPVRTSSAPSRSASPQPRAAELAELRQITPAIRKSAQARSAIDKAVNGVGGCHMKPAQGISILHGAITSRQEAIDEAEKLSAHAIPDGQSMLSDLLQALRQSSTADNRFIGWMQDIADSGTCPINTATDRSYQAGYRASKRALAAKQEFVQLWDPLAREFSQPTFAANSI